ncbi:MAG: hypothetical protein IPM23_13650 [Candidatus Melainabacteria bacterium]|nr:hypothetical protein [Candidatus Melainabacteria bacterium]
MKDFNDFDLIDFQRRARNTSCPRKLFGLWDQVCTLYERGQISAYEWNEMKDILKPSISRASLVAMMVDDSFERKTA